MSKEGTMTIRVEPELRAAFTGAASLEDRPAAQVLREFMRAYVGQIHDRAGSPLHDVIALAESRRRQRAVDFARASVGLEVFTPSPAAETAARQFIAGDTDLADFVQVKPYGEDTLRR